MNQNPTKDQHELDDLNNYILRTYRENIDLSWRNAASSKRTYYLNRIMPILLGGILTFATTISSTQYISANETLKAIFAIATPLLAVALTVTNELTKINKPAESWRDMVVFAEKLEKERDRFLATKPGKRNHKKELDKIRSLVIRESRTFFRRTLEVDALYSAQK